MVGNAINALTKALLVSCDPFFITILELHLIPIKWEIGNIYVYIVLCILEHSL
mgnify:CR=1 FL=1